MAEPEPFADRRRCLVEPCGFARYADRDRHTAYTGRTSQQVWYGRVPSRERIETMWYFAWMPDLGLAATGGVLNARSYELRNFREEETAQRKAG